MKIKAEIQKFIWEHRALSELPKMFSDFTSMNLKFKKVLTQIIRESYWRKTSYSYLELVELEDSLYKPQILKHTRKTLASELARFLV